MKTAGDPFSESPPLPKPKRRRWFYGWTVVAVVSLISFAGGVETNPVLGVFQGPMTEEFGWSLSVYTLPMSIGSFVGGLAALIVGPIMDRYGARWVMVSAVAVMGLTFVLMGAVQEYWHHFVLQVVGRAVIASTFFMVVGVVIPKWFVTMRGRATAFANLGQRVGQIAFPVMAERILQVGTWRTAWVVMGIAVWLSALLPTLLFLKRRPEDAGLLPDGAAEDPRAQGEAQQAAQRARAEVHFTSREALRSPAFYLIAAAVSIQSFVTTAIHFHWFFYLTGNGISTGAAVISVSLSPLIGMPVSLVAGFVAEKVPVKNMVTFSFLLMAVSIRIFLFAGNAWMGYLFGVLFGLATGSLFTVMQVVWADFFGRQSIGAIRGMVSPVHMLLNALGPLIAALSYDVSGSYVSVFAVCAALAGVGALCMALARQPKPRQEALGV